MRSLTRRLIATAAILTLPVWLGAATCSNPPVAATNSALASASRRLMRKDRSTSRRVISAGGGITTG